MFRERSGQNQGQGRGIDFVGPVILILANAFVGVVAGLLQGPFTLAHLRKLCAAEIIQPSTVVYNADSGSQRLETLLTGDVALSQTASAGAPWLRSPVSSSQNMTRS